MSRLFSASLVRNGVINGTIVIDNDFILFTPKKQSEQTVMKKLKIKFSDIASYSNTITSTEICLKNGDAYRFIVFGNAKLRAVLNELGFKDNT